MSVTERVMSVGSWSVALHPDTPRRLIAAISPDGPWGFAQLVITDTAVDPYSTQDEGLLAVARYTGVYRRLEGRILSGAGLAMLLGDEDGKGNLFETALAGSYDPGTWASILTQWSGLTIRDVQAGGSWSASYRWVQAREALAEVCAHYGHEWRITPDLGYRQGHPAHLYPTVPWLLVLADDSGGRQHGLTGVRGAVGQQVDVEDHANKVVYLTRREKPAEDGQPAEAAQWVTATRTDVYTNPKGRPLIMDALVEAHVEDGNPGALAAAELGKLTVRRAWDVETSQLPSPLMVGAPVWVWAPAEGVYDLSQQVYYRGRTVYPLLSRLMGATWPILPGMGVYLRRRASTTVAADYLDLTRYVLPESSSTQLEIGAIPRPSR